MMLKLRSFRLVLQVLQESVVINYDTIIIGIEKDDLSQLIRVVENRKVDGVIITRPLSVNSMEPLLRENGMPFVVIGKNLMPEFQLLIRKSTM